MKRLVIMTFLSVIAFNHVAAQSATYSVSGRVIDRQTRQGIHLLSCYLPLLKQETFTVGASYKHFALGHIQPISAPERWKIRVSQPLNRGIFLKSWRSVAGL